MAKDKKDRIEEVDAYRDRIIEFVTVKAKDVAPNTRNWRKHGGDQRRTLDALLRRIGKGDILKAYRNGAGELVFLDGHLRADLNPNESWHVAILDLTDEEAELYLAAHDSITGMADIDSDKIKDLLSRVKDMDAGLKSMFGKMVAARDEEEGEMEDPGAEISKADELREKWNVEIGQLWQLGEHRLICGDCTDMAMVERVMGGGRRRRFVLPTRRMV